MTRMRPPEYRIYRRARERALTRLANAYPDQYQQYLEEEKANEQGSEGNSSSLDVGVLSGVGTRTLGTSTRSSTADNSKNQSDRGGEA
jgi:hypothetical protein